MLKCSNLLRIINLLFCRGAPGSALYILHTTEMESNKDFSLLSAQPMLAIVSPFHARVFEPPACQYQVSDFNSTSCMSETTCI